ncbi:hypothetical protein SANTM175S_02344 [Streptomyces antimycoticus]
MINSIACTIPRPTGGILDDFEEEDDQRGYEDEPEARLWAYLDRLVRETDARIAAGRPRHTVGLTEFRFVMRARILADSEARAAELLDGARSEAASITEAATTEQARVLADAAADADRVRTEAATTAAVDADQVLADADAKAKQLLADARAEADSVTATASGEADQVLADAKVAERLRGPDWNEEGGPDRTVITLTDLERTALDRLRTANEPLNRTNIAKAVRAEGGSIATDRAGQIAVALKQHTVR